MVKQLSTSPLWPRRAVVGALLGGCGWLAAGPVRAMTDSATADGPLAFDIRRDGASIGRHRVSFQRRGGQLQVDVAIDIAVSLAFIPVFSYRHRNREVWQDDRLVALDSETDDDGSHYTVTARAVPDGLSVETGEGRLMAPRDILPTSYWNPRTVKQNRLLDTQRGRLLDVQSRLLGQEVLDGGVAARRYRLSGDLDLDLWYSATGEWLKTAFEARGAAVSYARRPLGDRTGAAG